LDLIGVKNASCAAKHGEQKASLVFNMYGRLKRESSLFIKIWEVCGAGFGCTLRDPTHLDLDFNMACVFTVKYFWNAEQKPKRLVGMFRREAW
jgi:hypothetical protein